MIDLSTLNPKRILVCQQRQIGDVLLASPVFEVLKKRFPQAELHLFTEKKCEPLLRHNPFIDAFHLIDKSGGFSASWPSTAAWPPVASMWSLICSSFRAAA